MKKLLHISSLILSITIFCFLLQNHSVQAATGPGSGGEGDPRCTCTYNDDPTPKHNGFNCPAGGGGKNGGGMRANGKFCPDLKQCHTGNLGPGDPGYTGPQCVTIGGTHTITDQDCWCTHPGIVDVSGLFHLNGRTCTDGVNIHPDYNQKWCAGYQVCSEDQIAGNPNKGLTVKEPPPSNTTHPVAWCASLNCNCDHINLPGSGNNGMTCDNGSGNGVTLRESCSELQVCTQKAAKDNNASCQQLDNCTCDNPDTPGDQKNGFTCVLPVPSGTAGSTSFHAFCGVPTEACVASGKAVTCKDESSKLNSGTYNGISYAPIGPPPSPPCAQYDGVGRCIAVQTALAGTGTKATSTDPSQFITQILQVLIGFAGGIALLLIILAGYKLMVSQGKPEAVQAAREQLTAAIVGLLFLLCSLIIIQLIGVDLLHIPGFGA